METDLFHPDQFIKSSETSAGYYYMHSIKIIYLMDKL